MSVGQTDNTEKPPDLVKFDEMLEALEEESDVNEDETELDVEEEEFEKPQEQPIFFKYEQLYYFIMCVCVCRNVIIYYIYTYFILTA